jgi:diguanylate cyclase (GGDEF)-like protein
MLRDWVTRRLELDTGFDPDRINMAFAAQVAAFMYLGAAAASAAMVAWPEIFGAPRVPSAVVCALALVGAGVWFALFDRAPAWLPYAGIAFGTGLISWGAYLTQTSAQGVALYIWGVIYAFVFFERRAALLYLAGVCAAFGVVLRLDGTEGAFASWTLGVMTLTTVGLVIGALRDRLVGELRRAENRARTDELTGLPNRRALMDELPAALADGRPHRLVLCDLNGFKAFNDTRGHQEGDRLLARLGQRLERLVAGRGRAYRLGGDEFCVLWPLDAGIALRDVEHALSDHTSRTPVTAAHGEVELPIEASDADTALRIADGRMYARKAAQREHRAAA